MRFLFPVPLQLPTLEPQKARAYKQNYISNETTGTIALQEGLSQGFPSMFYY